MGLFICFLLGAFVGGLITVLVMRTRRDPMVAGRIQFYDDEPGEGPVMVAVLYESVDDVYKRRTATFEISHK
jgi:hypothetical protein